MDGKCINPDRPKEAAAAMAPLKQHLADVDAEHYDMIVDIINSYQREIDLPVKNQAEINRLSDIRNPIENQGILQQT